MILSSWEIFWACCMYGYCRFLLLQFLFHVMTFDGHLEIFFIFLQVFANIFWGGSDSGGIFMNILVFPVCQVTNVQNKGLLSISRHVIHWTYVMDQSSKTNTQAHDRNRNQVTPMVSDILPARSQRALFFSGRQHFSSSKYSLTVNFLSSCGAIINFASLCKSAKSHES